jgi:hypothetical protein
MGTIKRLRRGFCLAVIVMFSTIVATSTSWADQSGFLIASGANGNLYNYVPSVIRNDNGIEQMWWCGGPNPSDSIWYRAIDVGTQQVITQPTNVSWSHHSWASTYVCDPSVVRGVFTNPLGDGVTYTYAMYFTGTNQADGNNNRVGVAFSNDGMNWNEYPDPVYYQASALYGTGQQSVMSADGKSAIWMWSINVQTANTEPTYLLHSDDGIHFTQIFAVSAAGIPGGFLMGADFAYDYNTQYVYAVANNPNDPSTITVYKMPWGSLSNGTWQFVGSMGVNGHYNPTGNPWNSGAGFLRDQYGNNTHWLPVVQVYFATGPEIQHTSLWWWQTTGN